MQWTVRRPFVPVSLLDRLRLRRAALRYAAHDWPVTPGAWLAGPRFACGRPGCSIMTCHPALESWEDDASTSHARVCEWWRRRPHTVLLATGGRFDALEVPSAIGLRVLGLRVLDPRGLDPRGLDPRAARLRASGSRASGAGAAGSGAAGSGWAAARGPIAVTAGGRWMFLVSPGVPLRDELARRIDVVRHGRGSWIPAAPSRLLEGPVRWAVSPERTGWQLPSAEAVQALLVEALGGAGTPQATVPRQMSTARRAL